MKNSPIIGVFLGVIVVLLIIIFSLGYQLNKTHTLSGQEATRRIKAEEQVEGLSKQLETLKEEVVDLQMKIVETQGLVDLKDKYIEDLEFEMNKLEKFKDKLEEDLKEELINKDKSIR
ncbi:MAG: hypothetical protein JW734_06350 [Candidatus Omnitrophica bacterium]|nr:hypothetical protein [Candidatus Omnitrophota bacterium]